MLGANRALLAIAHEVEAICRNAVVNEVPLGRSRTALAEGQVVLVGATLVSVTLDTNSHSRVSLQPRNLDVECSSRIRSDRRLVEVEVDRAGDPGRVHFRWTWGHASRIYRRDVRVVLAHCRWRRRWGRRRRSNAVRARSRNALESGVRAHNLRTCTTKQQAQAATNVEVEIRAWLVIRHVINNAVDTKRGTIGDSETNAGKAGRAKVVGVVVTRLELVAGASSTGADDELALAASDEVADREIVVKPCGERVRVDVRRPTGKAANGAIDLRRIVAITFNLPARITEEDAQASAVADSVLWNGVSQAGVVVEVGSLDEAAGFNGSRKRRDELIPPHVGRPHDRITRCAAAEKIVDVRRELQTSLRAEIELPALRWQVVDESVNAECDAAKAEIESDQSVGAELIGSRASIGASAEVLENSASSNMDRRQIAEREAVNETGCEGASFYVPANCVRARTQEARGTRGLRRRIRTVSLEIPVRRDESAHASTVTPGTSETGVQVPLAIEVRPRAEPAYQQRTGRLCCRRSAEE